MAKTKAAFPEENDTSQYKKRSQIGAICRRFAKSKTAMLGLIILILLVLIAVFCPVFLSYSEDVIKQNMRERLQGPSLAHLLGTDQFGRDVLARVIWGTRISLSASLIIITIATVFGAAFRMLRGKGYRTGNLCKSIASVYESTVGGNSKHCEQK